MRIVLAMTLGAAALAAIPRQSAPKPASVDEERRLDDEAYRAYLGFKENLVAETPGGWLAIVAGSIVPAAPSGRPTPVADFEACLNAAELASSAARHRYVFRVGEDGEVRYAMASPQSSNVVGTGLLDRLHVGPWSVAQGSLTWTRKGKSHAFAVQPGPVLLTDLELTDPRGLLRRSVRVVHSTGFGGIAVLEPDVADALDLARFEIPGAVIVDRGSHRIECRRARVRLALPDIEVDELLPIAVWPR